METIFTTTNWPSQHTGSNVVSFLFFNITYCSYYRCPWLSANNCTSGHSKNFEKHTQHLMYSCLFIYIFCVRYCVVLSKWDLGWDSNYRFVFNCSVQIIILSWCSAPVIINLLKNKIKILQGLYNPQNQTNILMLGGIKAE